MRNCRIALTGFTGINIKRIENVQVLGNTMTDFGGPAIQPGTVDDLVMRGNTVDEAGSDKDKRR